MYRLILFLFVSCYVSYVNGGYNTPTSFVITTYTVFSEKICVKVIKQNPTCKLRGWFVASDVKVPAEVKKSEDIIGLGSNDEFFVCKDGYEDMEGLIQLEIDCENIKDSEQQLYTSFSPLALHRTGAVAIVKSTCQSIHYRVFVEEPCAIKYPISSRGGVINHDYVMTDSQALFSRDVHLILDARTFNQQTAVKFVYPDGFGEIVKLRKANEKCGETVFREDIETMKAVENFANRFSFKLTRFRINVFSGVYFISLLAFVVFILRNMHKEHPTHMLVLATYMIFITGFCTRAMSFASWAFITFLIFAIISCSAMIIYPCLAGFCPKGWFNIEMPEKRSIENYKYVFYCSLVTGLIFILTNKEDL